MRSENTGGWGNHFSLLLFAFTGLIVVVALIIFAVDVTLYLNGDFIDYRRNLVQPGDAKWLVILFLAPPLLQIAGLIPMFLKLHRDRSLTAAYMLCIFIMSFCPLSYLVLWLLYMLGRHSWADLSYFALFAILILLLPVVLMTYAIMWTPDRASSNEAELISEGDVENWAVFCSELKKDGTALGGFRRRILERLPDTLRGRIMNARIPSDYEDINKSKVVEELNKVLKLHDLHLAVNMDSSEISDEARILLERNYRSLTASEKQRLHRLLLHDCLPKDVWSSNSAPGPGMKEMDWGRFLRDVREGVKKAHFWVLANFFAVFLGVTYLFGFAFAFHDQRAIEDKHGPELYLSRVLPSRAGVMQLEDPDAAQPQGPAAGRYAFYFDSISADPNLTNYPNAGLEAYKPVGATAAEKGRNWKGAVNFNQVERISRDILRLTERGERLRVELVGYTDCSPPQEGAAYSSNYELSEARAQNIKYVLLKTLADKEKRQRNIEWAYLPVSSEGSPLAGDPWGRAKCGETQPAGAPAPKAKRNEGDKELTRRLDEVTRKLEDLKGTLVKDMQLSGPDAQTLNDTMTMLETLVRSKELAWGKIEEPVGRIKTLARVLGDLDAARKPGADEAKRRALEAEAERKKVEVQESFDAFEYLDDDGARRAVVVSLSPVRESREFVPLTLMDYMYFTIYTITTTGYGDIIPSSAFAKFVCSAANILEVFFLVVFFNALLSVKGESRLSRAADRR